jgi:hypothetical protein
MHGIGLGGEQWRASQQQPLAAPIGVAQRLKHAHGRCEPIDVHGMVPAAIKQ